MRHVNRSNGVRNRRGSERLLGAGSRCKAAECCDGDQIPTVVHGCSEFECCLWKRLATASAQVTRRTLVLCVGSPDPRPLRHRDMTVTPDPDKRSASQATAADS